MNKNSITLIFFLFVHLLTGCASKGNIYKKDHNFTGKISTNDFEIIIRDKRVKTDSRKIKIPLISPPGYNDMVHPALDVNKISNIAGEVIEKFIINGKKSLTIQINFLEAYQKFETTVVSEIEYVYVKVIVIIKDRKKRHILNSAEGEAWGRYAGMIASSKKINRMLDKAFKRAIYEALKNLD